MIKRAAAFSTLLIVVLTLGAWVFAEEVFGVQVYPGAKLDEQTTKFIKESLEQDGAAYRTADSVEKVAAFYKTQSIVKAVLVEKESAMFMKGSYELTVTIQNPWMNTKTGQKMTDTLVSIVKGK